MSVAEQIGSGILVSERISTDLNNEYKQGTFRTQSGTTANNPTEEGGLGMFLGSNGFGMQIIFTGTILKIRLRWGGVWDTQGWQSILN